MHDKMNNEESIDNLVNNLNDYFDLSSLDIDDLSTSVSDSNFDDDKANK